ncbi:MAG: NADH-quinone oxidoreductase subunit NuoE [Alphaproteobacteria bacterium]|nr:NADH-quinone oxidoreductase subunit NuoE [Alphaproteobacteria bacterium]
MSARRLAEIQPDNFSPNRETTAFAKASVKKYPEGKQASAVIPLLWRVQEQNAGWVSEPAIRWTAEFLDMPYIRVYEIATFYTMFNLQPVGKFHVQLCGTTPCMLRGSEELKTVCRKVIGNQMDVTSDGKLSWIEVECLGACVNAPMVQINKDYYEDLTPEILEQILADLRSGKEVKPGPQNSRHRSEPLGGALTLLSDTSSSRAKAKPQAKAKAPAKAKPVAKAKPATKAKAPAAATKPAKAKAPAATAATAAKTKKPRGVKAPKVPDDLKMISGVGPKLEGTLNGLGIYKFAQVAKWTKAEIDWVDDYLSFKGRIERDDWIKQAGALAKGGVDEYVRVFGKKPR